VIRPGDLADRQQGGAPLSAQPAPNECPICHDRGRVLETRAAGGYRRRRYMCPHGHRWKSFESFINPRRVRV